MAYKKDGQTRHSLKERYEFHKTAADIGIDSNGERLSLSQRVRHANKAIRLHNRLNRFMKVRDVVKKEPKNKK